MLKIKLSPTGKSRAIKYRIVVAEENSKLSGPVSAVLGHYNPAGEQLVVEKDQLESWLKKGATPTPTVAKILKLN